MISSTELHARSHERPAVLQMRSSFEEAGPELKMFFFGCSRRRHWRTFSAAVLQHLPHVGLAYPVQQPDSKYTLAGLVLPMNFAVYLVDVF